MHCNLFSAPAETMDDSMETARVFCYSALQRRIASHYFLQAVAVPAPAHPPQRHPLCAVAGGRVSGTYTCFVKWYFFTFY